MSRRKSKRWILAVLLATLFPAAAIHMSCVAVLGPGSWGSGVEEKVPEILPADANPQVSRYAQEFSDKPSNGSGRELPVDLLRSDEILVGRVYWVDALPEENLWLILTREGTHGIREQHLYLWHGQSLELEEIEIPDSLVMQRAVLARRDEGMQLVLVRWNSWAVSPFQKISRYLQSHLDPRLRPEFSLYTRALSAQQPVYFGPGHSLAPSPDRRRGAFLRSGALGTGIHSLHVWHFARDEVNTVMSLREADEGSGPPFEYAWSSDSRALHLTGAISGFQRGDEQTRHLDLIYLVDEGEVYQAPAPAL